MSRNRNKKKRPSKQTANNAPSAPPTPAKRIIFTGNRLTLIGIIIALIPIGYFLYDRYKPKHDQIEDNFRNGDLISDPILETANNVPKIDNKSQPKQYRELNAPPVFLSEPPKSEVPKIEGILLDSTSLAAPTHPLFSGTWFTFANQNIDMPIEVLKHGVEFALPIVNGLTPDNPNCGKSTVRFGVHNKRLYVSCSFYDIKNEEFIGSIEYNHWKLYIPNLLIFYNDSKRLEVRDKQNNIVFSMKYHHVKDGTSFPHISIGGYFINNKAIIVVPNYPSNPAHDCFCFPKIDSNWKDRAKDIIDSLITVFPEKSKS